MAHRARVVSRGRVDRLAKPGSGVEPGPMVLEGCLESRAPRVIVALMDCPDCLARRGTGESQDLQDRSGPQERMDREVKMERSDRGAWQARVALGVC